MKKSLLLIFVVVLSAHTFATNAATERASRLGRGMNFSIWLESSYWFYNTTTFPDVTRFTEADVKAMHDLCFNTIRLPVFFEPFASMTAPYTFDMGNSNVVRGLAYVDSMITWTGRYNMNLVIDNHLQDDHNSYNMQTNYQITDNNYTAQAALIAGVWRQAAQRYHYADPDRVFFELRNEPNSVNDANLHTLYQTVIDTLRKYDQTHTIIVGCTGYYDPIALSNSTPYSDTNVVYTFHIYDGNNYPGFCFQGQGGVPATDSIAKTHVSFALHGAQAADITSEVQAVHSWSATHSLPVWLGEFGCTTLAQVYGDDTSSCNYVQNMATALTNNGNIPWAYWGGFVPEGLYTSYDNGTTLTYTFSMFDAANTPDAADLDACYASALGLGTHCQASGIASVAGPEIALYPNPAGSNIHVLTTGAESITLYTITGESLGWTAADASGTTTIDMHTCSTGVYMLRVQYRDGSAVVRKFVKD